MKAYSLDCRCNYSAAVEVTPLQISKKSQLF